VQVPPVAPPRRRSPMDQGAGLRSRRVQVRPLPSTRQTVHLAVAQWIRAPPSEGGRRTFESCRRDQVRDRRSCPRSSARSSTSLVRTRLWARHPPRAPRKRPGWMRTLSRKQVRVVRPVGVRVAPLPPLAAPNSPRQTRRAKLAAPNSPRSSSGHDAGPSTRRPGFDSPSRYARTSNARWSSGTDVRLLPGRREFDPLPGSARSTLVVVVQRLRIPARHAGDEGSSPSDHTVLCRETSRTVVARHPGRP
jgi:hypothetical protein